MTPKGFVRFTDVKSGRPVFCRTSIIRIISPSDAMDIEGDKGTVVMCDEWSPFIRESEEEAAALLANAIKRDSGA